MRTNHSAFSPRAARLTPLAAALAVVLSPAAFGGILVTNADPSGPGSLAAAILQANSECNTTSNPVIDFQIPISGPFIISPSSPLPAFYCPTATYEPTIDGYAFQAGASPNTSATGWNGTVKAGLNGAGLSYGCGLEMIPAPGYGGHLTVRGMGIEGFGSVSTFCGPVDLFGNIVKNNDTGIQVTEIERTIGTSAAADRNLFVANAVGIRLGSGVAYVENNFIGTANGTSPSANDVGIYISGYSGSTIVDNVISGNGIGIHAYSDYGGTVVLGNKIGVTAAGTSALANTGGGIYIQESRNLDISGNIISGNGVAGVAFERSSYLVINENLIGVALNGTTAVPNPRGIDGFCGGYLTIGDNTVASNSGIGIYLDLVEGTPIERNTIRGNGLAGLQLDSASTACYGGDNFVSDNTITGNRDGVLVTATAPATNHGNRIHANTIYGNSRKSINLNNNTGILPNDSGDGDPGPNRQQNWPVLNSALQDGGSTVVGFTLDAEDGNSYQLEFFANDAAGDPAAKQYIGSTVVSLYGGPFTGTYSTYGAWDNISATATSLSTYDTSELSPQRSATSAPAVLITPNTVDFGNVLVNSESASRNITLRSVGDSPYQIEDILTTDSCYGGQLDLGPRGIGVVSAAPSLCYGGDFTCDTTCTPAPYSKGQTCRITARFTPQMPGYSETRLYICDNTANSPNEILLKGTAVLPPPITISPKSHDFGGVPVGGQSEPQKFVISNTGYGMLLLDSLATNGEFDLLNTTCGSFLYGHNSCDAVVAFAPTQTGEAAGSIAARYSTYLGDPSVAQAGPIGETYQVGATLAGVGLGGGELILPGPIELGAAAVGGQPLTRTIELRNTGTQPVNIASITLSGPFVLANSCPATLAPGASCNVVISFTATSVGEFNGSFTVVSDAAGGSGEVGVHATGQAIAAPLLRVTPTSMGFGDRVIGSTTGGQTITITNVGGVAATLSVTLSSIDFLIAGNSCGTTLAPQASCSAQVAFRPLLGFGPRVGSFIVTSNTTGSPQGVALNGTGCRPFVGVGNRIGPSSNCAP